MVLDWRWIIGEEVFLVELLGVSNGEGVVVNLRDYFGIECFVIVVL